jgi:hypothetical protein
MLISLRFRKLISLKDEGETNRPQGEILFATQNKVEAIR